MSRKVNILGSKWRIEHRSQEDDCHLYECDGYTDSSIHLIVIAVLKKDENSKADLDLYRKCVLRHEIIHAYLCESGLAENSNGCDCWAQNEEMVDWFAIQGPKIYQTFQECGCL